MIANLRIGLKDIFLSLHRLQLVFLLAWHDIRSRYRRSTLGPFWITISMGVLIFTIAIIFGAIFGRSLKEFLPYISVGLIFWYFFSNIVSESCNGFIDSEVIIKQISLPYFTYILRVIVRNYFILAHNLLLLPFIFLIAKYHVTTKIFILIPALFLISLFVAWISLILSIVCARFRDLGQIIQSILQIIFYITPIIWLQDLITDQKLLILLEFNPIYHFFELVRNPLLGLVISLKSFIIIILITIFGWIFSLFIFGKYSKRIVYWL
jgi:ABC-type polysaccharide/polyol phosphate export permease